MSTPSSRIWPLVALSRPASRPSSVLFPLPEGPMMAMNCPRGMARSIPRRISTLWVGVWMVRVSRMTSMMGGTSVMIMAVSLRLMLWTALAVALTSCGNRGPQQPVQSKLQEKLEDKAQDTIHAEDTRPVIAAFGDSLSAGFGVEPGKSFPDDLQRLVDAAGYRYRVVNLGVSGDTTTDGVERLPSLLAAHPAIVILEFGGNDGLRGLPVT